ncbi:MAG: ferritin [Balneolaceae bacterium]
MAAKKINKALNEQIKHELDSSYLYLSMASHCEALNLNGFASWMQSQSMEEYDHAMKFYHFLHERGAEVELLPIDKPPKSFGSPIELFEKALENEQKVTRLIHKLYEIALDESDYPAQVMLHWFIEEQVEEENMVTEIIEQLKLAGDKGAALLMMDRQLAQRGE